MQLPQTIKDVAQLEDVLSAPDEATRQDLAEVAGDLIILGAGGKVGPTIARMAKRATPERRVIAVARFSDPQVRTRLEAAEVECVVADLLDQQAVNRLPDVPNVVYMVGKKFGTANSEPFTWAMNTVVPTYVGQRFRASRIVAFSTLCVYPFASVDSPGWSEQHPPTPLGEYPNSCVGRERVFQYFSEVNQSPGRLIRLNYAIDLRYGVLHDIARWVRDGDPIDIRTPVANVIWQGDANAWILRSLKHCTQPAGPLNIGLPEPARIRDVAERFGELLDTVPVFSGTEAPTAWHNDCSEAARLFGTAHVDLDTMIRWTADWILAGGQTYEKPTHYEQRGGVF